MNRVVKKVERVIVVALLGMMLITVALATIELAVILVQKLINEPTALLLNINELLEIFGFFLMVLIGLELLETISAYLDDEKVHVEVVFLVAMVAVARKIVILDPETLQPEKLFGIAAVILALSIGYFLVKKALVEFSDSAPPGPRNPQPDRTKET